MVELSVDVVHCILEFVDHVRDLSAVSRCSKTLRDLAQPRVFYRIDLTETRRDMMLITFRTFRNLIVDSPHLIDYVRMVRFSFGQRHEWEHADDIIFAFSALTGKRVSRVCINFGPFSTWTPCPQAVMAAVLRFLEQSVVLLDVVLLLAGFNRFPMTSLCMANHIQIVGVLFPVVDEPSQTLISTTLSTTDHLYFRFIISNHFPHLTHLFLRWGPPATQQEYQHVRLALGNLPSLVLLTVGYYSEESLAHCSHHHTHWQNLRAYAHICQASLGSRNPRVSLEWRFIRLCTVSEASIIAVFQSLSALRGWDTIAFRIPASSEYYTSMNPQEDCDEYRNTIVRAASELFVGHNDFVRVDQVIVRGFSPDVVTQSTWVTKSATALGVRRVHEDQSMVTPEEWFDRSARVLLEDWPTKTIRV